MSSPSGTPGLNHANYMALGITVFVSQIVGPSLWSIVMLVPILHTSKSSVILPIASSGYDLYGDLQ